MEHNDSFGTIQHSKCIQTPFCAWASMIVCNLGINSEAKNPVKSGRDAGEEAVIFISAE